MDGNVNPWWERSGLTPPTEEGGEVQEVAEPAEQMGTKGEEVQEVAEPAVSAETNATESEDNEANTTDSADDGEGTAKEPKKGPEDSRQAMERRRREQEQREKQIREDEAKRYGDQMKEIFSALGLRDAQGNPVQTAEDFQRYKGEQDAQKLRRELKQGQLTPEALQSALLQSPQVQQLMSRMEEATQSAKTAETAANLAKFHSDMEGELAEIRKYDPSIKSQDDIIRGEGGVRYAELVRLGVKPSDAYRVAHFDKIRESDRRAAEQAVRNSAAGKFHMKGAPTTAGDALPPGYAENMRKYIPGISDAEIVKYYKKFNKG